MILRRQVATVKKLTAILGVAVLAVLALGMTGCSESGGVFMSGNGAIDAGGLTRAEIGQLEEQFDRVREREDRMQELLTEAQLHISDGVWRWGQKGGGPITGPNVWAVAGMNLDNSYYLNMMRWIAPEGADGDKHDLEPIAEYFAMRGWDTTLRELGSGDSELLADTGEGFVLGWRVKDNGTYNMEITSKSYWGDARELQSAIYDRTPPEAYDIEESLPGVYLPFPDWSDPAIYQPKLRDYERYRDREAALDEE